MEPKIAELSGIDVYRTVFIDTVKYKVKKHSLLI